MWYSKRILLKSHSDMKNALIYAIKPFVEENKEVFDYWFCSRKTDEDLSNPSIRIYFYTDDVSSKFVLEILDKILKKNKKKIGWTGKYIKCDSGFDRRNIKNIQRACELAITFLKSEKNGFKFLIDYLYEIWPIIDFEAIHFYANNIGTRDKLIFELVEIFYKEMAKKTWWY